MNALTQNTFYFIYSVFDIPLKTGITKVLSENKVIICRN